MNYYIVGTKYKQDDGSYFDIFPKLVSRNVISAGFSSEYDLSKYCGKSESEIVNYLKSEGVPSKAYSTLKIFLNLKPGDLIAMKKSGSPKRKEPRLVISGYALVSGDNEPIYTHDSKDLGHTISVEFIETDIVKEFPLGYGRTIHKLSDDSHIKMVFGNYYRAQQKFRKSATRKSVENKNTNTRKVLANKAYLVSARHNEIQQKLYDKLINEYGKKNVFMERNFFDITVTKEKSTTLYEVKPYYSGPQYSDSQLRWLTATCSTYGEGCASCPSNENDIVRNLRPKWPWRR